MAKLSISVTKDTITASLKNIQTNLNALPRQAHQKMVQLTPIDSGNARSKTNLVANDTIRAQYPYAKRLDKGWSRQAPRGMTTPLREWMRRQLQKIMRKK